MVFPSVFRAAGSEATTPYDIQSASFQWEDKHLYWARAMGRIALEDENAFARFIVYRELLTYHPHDDRRTARYPFAPKWLHAYWDVCTEQSFSRGRQVSATTKEQDILVGRRLLSDDAFRAAFEVIYDEGGIPALVDIAHAFTAGEMRAAL